jgi:putative membrane protein
MVKYGLWSLAGCLCVLTSLASGQNQLTDQEFATKAAECNMLEVKLSQLAAERAANPEVKQFARQLTEDHQRAGKMLQEAASPATTLPKELDKKHQETIDRVSKLSGADFDREYLKLMVDEHKKAIELFERQSKEAAANAQLKSFAGKLLPDLREHLKRAQELATKVK